MQKKSSEAIGRFAPSPSGGLHLGSVSTALASYLNVKKQNGRWLLRIDDLDKTRVVKGASSLIIKTLEALGLDWSGHIIYQSANYDMYESNLVLLDSQQVLYPCTCTRKTIGSGLYQGTCRDQTIDPTKPYSLRLKLNNDLIHHHDLSKGYLQGQPDQLFGDFVVKRADGVYSYHLATIIDDHLSGITEVIRGDDLLDSTLAQLYLQNRLHMKPPIYSHIPTVKDMAGIKLSKQTGANVVIPELAHFALFEALKFLGIPAPQSMYGEESRVLINWALGRWETYQAQQISLY